MRKLTLSMALLATLASATAVAETTTVKAAEPGVAAAVETESHTGKIMAIDAAIRVITIKGEGGREVLVTAGPEVKNFELLKIGDSVTIELTKALAVDLHKGSTAAVSRSDEVGAVRAEAGELPGGAIGTRTKIMAEVTALDPASQTVTLKGPNRSIDVKVEDPKQFSNVAVGDRVEATYIEAMAISVTPAAKP